jgi:hypothetical protein
MIVLTSSTTLTATLDVAASTPLECVATYVDTDATGTTFDEITSGVTFSTTAATTLVASPASGKRVISFISITNTDNAVRTVTLITNSRIIKRVTMQIGDVLTLNYLHDSSGAVRHTVANSTFNSVFTALSRSVQLGTVSTNQTVEVASPTTPRDLNILATLTGNITVNVNGLTANMAGMTIKLDMTASGGARQLTINANGAQTLLWSVSGAGNVAGVTTARNIASGATDYIQMEWNGTRLVLQDDIARTANIPNSAVTYAKIQNVAAQRLLGNPTTGAIAPAEVIIHNNQTIATLANTSMSDATAGTGLSGTTALQAIQNYFRVTNDLAGSIDSGTNQIVTTGRLVGQTIILDMRASAAGVTFTFPNAMPTENLASATALRVVPITNAANTRTKITLLWDGTRFNVNFADYRTT